MRTFLILGFAIFMSLTATTALARGQERPGADRRHCNQHLQVHAHQWRASFEMLDVNHDGQLTPMESALRMANRKCFNRLDRDRSGTLSAEELDGR
jgi:Ca2+-binding EF-hand superfamily protein